MSYKYQRNRDHSLEFNMDDAILQGITGSRYGFLIVIFLAMGVVLFILVFCLSGFWLVLSMALLGCASFGVSIGIILGVYDTNEHEEEIIAASLDTSAQPVEPGSNEFRPKWQGDCYK